MAQSLRQRPESDAAGTTASTSRDHRQSGTEVNTSELLDVLGDQYAYQILKMLIEEPHTGRQLQSQTEMSKATVYRRLDKLESAELIQPTMKVDTDGHHRQEYHAVVESIHVGFEGDELTARIDHCDEPIGSTHQQADVRTGVGR